MTFIVSCNLLFLILWPPSPLMGINFVSFRPPNPPIGLNPGHLGIIFVNVTKLFPLPSSSRKGGSRVAGGGTNL